MRKLAVLAGFVLAAIVAAGLFGIVHDQISYTVSPEYYTRFKFLQFRMLDALVPERLRAAQVGWRATWWMGLLLGILTGLPALLYRTAHSMQRHLMFSLPLAIAVALLCALAGLAYGCWQTRSGVHLMHYSAWFIPPGLHDIHRFICVGYMHNAAYLGGVLAVPLLWLWHGWHIWRDRHCPTAD